MSSEQCTMLPRLRLRALSLLDADTLYAWENSPEASASAGTQHPLSAEFIRSYITESATSLTTKGELALLAEHTTTAEPVGYLQLLAYEPISRRMSVGLYIAPAYRRQGYGRELLQLAQEYAFRRLGLRMLYAEVLASNEASCALFRSLGYSHIATLPAWQWLDGSYHDLRYYQLCNNQ